jgi:mono/diheme cytochrome c family protein
MGFMKRMIIQHVLILVIAGLLVGFFLIYNLRAEPGGETVFKKKCLSCHANTQTKKFGIKKRLNRKGMPLWFAGSKYKKEWLEAWLVSPTPIYGVKWGTLEKGAYNHPAVNASEAKELTTYLLSMKDKKVAAYSPVNLSKSRGKRRSMLARTRQLFEKHQGCYACHRYLNRRNQELGGFSAPSMVDAAKKLHADWVLAFLHDPQRYYPNGSCPIPGKSATNKYTDKNRAAIATYIANMGVR